MSFICDRSTWACARISDAAARSCVTVAAILIAGVASAQTAPADPSPGEIVVKGARPMVRTSIDAKSFSLANDLQASTGSADDVLRNIPSVDVDAAGTVSLRGDPNVQILIDGKPSPLMSPANRAAALEAMSAGQIDRIEVMTNPSARLKPDGAAGVINIITKRSRRRGRSGTAQANFGSEGRFNLAATGAYNAGPLSLTASVAARQDARKRLIRDDRTGFGPTGPTVVSAQDVTNETKRLSLIETLGVDYDLSAHDRLSASATYNDRTGKPVQIEHDVAGDPLGAVTNDYLRLGGGHEREINTQASAKYRHLFSTRGREFSLDYQRGETRERQQFDFTNLYQTPAGPPTFDSQHLHTDELVQDLAAEYATPLPGKAKGHVGYDFQRDDDDYDNHGAKIDALTGLPVSDPNLTNHFILGQSIHALFATYERPIGKLTVLAGLRLEDVIVDTNQLTSNLRDHYSYFRVYPTLNLSYELSARETLKFSASRRVARPRAEDLNPYPVYQDAFNLRAGNARLMPQDVRSFEAGYEYNRRGTALQATLYFRDSRDIVTDVSRYISPTVLLTTKENLGKSLSGGVELAAEGKLSRFLSYTASGSLYEDRLDAANLNLGGPRSQLSGGAKISLSFSPTAKDQIQMSGNYLSKRLTAQGWRLPSYGANLGFRHTFNDSLAAVATVTDVFNTQRDRTVIATALVQDRYSRRLLGRAAFVGLTWTFGGGKTSVAESKFDYSAGGS